ncbi:hypothetical protein LTR84_004162 [Exophiala bonariae]|uniref:Major facilitator superfamily (MFS) profile domain-containing protein n=1 Tax=Exophiala bonariae TaxID=1690606 RepID=A0AAV9NA50_9EURO|nr:hypothetical protein LTR84_004162 [Exophiala bonariae]
MEKSPTTHVEYDSSNAHSNGGDAITRVPTQGKDAVVGTVRLLLGNETVLLPTPSPDPKDPLNLPAWRKWSILILISVFGCSCVILASGLGPIFSVIRADYPGQELKANDLMVYPTLFMGIGNVLAMPITAVIGRRPIILLSMVTLVVSSIWCQHSGSLGSHIAGRNVMALAAGQSEALLPMMIQEIFFLHERGRKLAWFVFLENFLVGIFFFTSNYMVSAWGWRGWYAFFAAFNGLILLFSIFLLLETLFIRPDDASTGQVHLTLNDVGKVDEEGANELVFRVTTKDKDFLEPEKYGVRTWRTDLRLWRKIDNWAQVSYFYLDFLKGIVHPIFFWLLLLNGAYLGLYIYQASTFATILMSPPFSFKFNSLGYVQGAQILCCLVFLPLLGYAGDHLIRFLSKRNGGVYKPEYRLPSLALPAIAGVIGAFMYGQTAAHPEKYHWLGVALNYNIIFFAFLGANQVALTYAVDSFPLKAGPLLVVVCAGRGFISFGIGYAVLPSIQAIGYDGSMNVVGTICAVLAVAAIPMYYFGPTFRKLGQNYYGFGASKEHANGGSGH